MYPKGFRGPLVEHILEAVVTQHFGIDTVRLIYIAVSGKGDENGFYKVVSVFRGESVDIRSRARRYRHRGDLFTRKMRDGLPSKVPPGTTRRPPYQSTISALHE